MSTSDEAQLHLDEFECDKISDIARTRIQENASARAFSFIMCHYI